MSETKERRKRKTERARRGRGEGGIYQRKDGTYAGMLSLGYGPTGKRRRKFVYGQSKAEVLAKMDELRGDVRIGALPDAGSLTVGQLLDRWMAAKRGEHPTRTDEERERLVTNHIKPRLGSVRLSKLTPLHVDGFYLGMRQDAVGDWTTRHAADALHAALRYAVRKNLIRSNPAEGVEKPRPTRREMLFLNPGQVRSVLETAKDRPVYPLLATALGTGCRQGELLALSWGDIDLRNGTLTVRRSLTQTKAAGFALKEPKSASGRRTVALPALVVEVLTAHKADAMRTGLLDAPVFCTRTGGHLDKKNVLRSFRAVIKAANRAHAKAMDKADRNDEPWKLIPEAVRFHDLRHTVASLLLSDGHSLKAVSRRLGHKDRAMTLRVYAHCLPGDDGKLADGLNRMMG